MMESQGRAGPGRGGEVHPLGPGRPVAGDGGEMASRIRAHDWAATPLGPPAAWPSSLTTVVGLMLGARTPLAIYWGADFILLYNDAYRAHIGAKHPAALGRPARDVFPEFWGEIGPLFAGVLAGGGAAEAHDQRLPLRRGDRVEEVWVTYSANPIPGADGAVAGILNIAAETTDRVRAEAARRASEARQDFLLRLGDALRPLADPVAIQEAATRVLGAHLDVDRTYYVEIDDTRQVAVVARDYVRGAAPSLVGEHPLAPFGSMLQVIRAGRTFVAADAETDPALQADLADYRARALRAFVSVPLVKDGALVAAMCVTSGTPRRWTEGEVALVAETAERTWAALERGRAEAALHASEARFRSFAESSSDTLWIVDATARRLEYLSPAFERMWGERREAVLRDLGRWAALVHPDDREQASRVLPRALAGEAMVADYRIVRSSDGAVRWVRDTGFPIRDAEGRVARVAGIAQDITDQKATEAALQEAHDALERRVAERTAELAAAVEELRTSEGRLRLLLAQMPALLWTADQELRVTALAGAAVPALRDGSVRTVAGLFAVGDADEGSAPVVAHRQALVGASVGFNVDIEGRTYQAHAEPLRDADGRIMGAIGVAHDVTDRTLLRLQDEFLALASHELRTPLTPALGYLEMALAALDGATPARRYVARAVEQVGRLDDLVGDLLEVGRLRGGKLSLEMAEIDLATVAWRAVDAAGVAAAAQGQRIALDAPAGPLLVRGDAGRLEQVALNLLTNAVRYAAQSPTIDVRLRADDAGGAVLEVRDDGPGIPAADLPRLFSRFYQVARPDRPSRGGLGLGLYLVKELVEAHGGGVAVASVVGQGTTFTVRLPLLKVDEGEPDAPAGTTATRATTAATAATAAEEGADG